MGKSKELTAEELKKAAVEKEILLYYNNTLLEKGVISKEEHRKMFLKILERAQKAGLKV